MGKLQGKKVGLREEETNKLIEVYPYVAEGSDEEVTKNVKDWYYKQGCENEEILLNSFVDVLTEDEIKSSDV